MAFSGVLIVLLSYAIATIYAIGMEIGRIFLRRHHEKQREKEEKNKPRTQFHVSLVPGDKDDVRKVTEKVNIVIEQAPDGAMGETTEEAAEESRGTPTPDRSDMRKIGSRVVELIPETPICAAVALYDYVDESEGYVSMQKDEVFDIFIQYDDGWWYAQSQKSPSKRGLLPSNFVQEIA